MALSNGLKTGLSLGANLLSGAVGGISSAIQNKKNRKWQEKMYQMQKQDEIDFWNMQNEYNSPENQRRLLLEAGINPDLQEGSVSFESSGLSTPSVGDWQQQSVGEHFSSMLPNFMEYMLRVQELESRDLSNDLSILGKMPELRELVTKDISDRFELSDFDMDILPSHKVDYTSRYGKRMGNLLNKVASDISPDDLRSAVYKRKSNIEGNRRSLLDYLSKAGYSKEDDSYLESLRVYNDFCQKHAVSMAKWQEYQASLNAQNSQFQNDVNQAIGVEQTAGLNVAEKQSSIAKNNAATSILNANLQPLEHSNEVRSSYYEDWKKFNQDLINLSESGTAGMLVSTFIRSVLNVPFFFEDMSKGISAGTDLMGLIK